MIKYHNCSAKKWWPVFAAIGMPLTLIVINSTPIGTDFVFVMMGIPVLLLTWACLGVWALIISIRSILRRDWLLARTCAILPIVVLFAGMQFWRFVHFCNYGGDVVNFIVRRSSYIREVHKTAQEGTPQLLVFNRGGMIWASRGYVYDESDEVTRSEASRSASWKARADQTELGCGYFAETFPGNTSYTKHWYLASFNC